jgi:eukaryotic-like serine/threonine-protein kinase
MSNTGGTLAITSTSDSSLHRGYRRAPAARNNLAIDVAACRIDVTNQGIDVLNAIAAKVPR